VRLGLWDRFLVFDPSISSEACAHHRPRRPAAV